MQNKCSFSLDSHSKQASDECHLLHAFVFTDLLTCSREPVMNQQLWPGDHTLSGHPQFQQNEFQPTCRSHSATHSMSRLMASGHTQLEVGPHGRLCASQAHHVLNFVVFASAFSGRSPRSHALIRRAVSHQTPMQTEPVSSPSQRADQPPAANHTSSRTPSAVSIASSPPHSPPSFLLGTFKYLLPKGEHTML